MTAPLSDPHQKKTVQTAGEPLDSASSAMILLHGRGASAADILPLSEVLGGPGFAYLAPQANGYSWYPHSFLVPMEQNEPHLSNALRTVGWTVGQVTDAGIPVDRIIFVGFSQGACLASEFVARFAEQYGGLIAFSGGLIGPPGTSRDYPGTLDKTPVFLGCSDVDPHIPKERVEETSTVLTGMGAEVDMRIFPGMGHTINREELGAARALVDQLADTPTGS